MFGIQAARFSAQVGPPPHCTFVEESYVLDVAEQVQEPLLQKYIVTQVFGGIIGVGGLHAASHAAAEA